MGSVSALLQVDADLANACGADPGYVCTKVFEWTDNDFLARLADWAVEKPLVVIVIFALAWVLNRVVRRAIRRMVSRLVAAQEQAIMDQEAAAAELDSTLERLTRKRSRLVEHSERAKKRAETLGAVLRSVATGVIYAIAFVISLGEFNINLGPLVAGAGIVGVTLGFGAQSLVRDFLTGIFMLAEDQYGVGDIIDAGEASGVVEGVTLRTTKIRDVNGTLWFVPNGEIHRIGNKSQMWARTVIDVEVAYDTDIDHAAGVIKRVADEVWRSDLETATILEEPEIWGVESFGPDSIAVRLALKTEPAEQWATAREIRGRLKKAFDLENIEIPFPQRTVWLHAVSPEKTQEAPPDKESTSVLGAPATAPEEAGDD